MVKETRSSTLRAPNQAVTSRVSRPERPGGGESAGSGGSGIVGGSSCAPDFCAGKGGWAVSVICGWSFPGSSVDVGEQCRGVLVHRPEQRGDHRREAQVGGGAAPAAGRDDGSGDGQQHCQRPELERGQ